MSKRIDTRYRAVRDMSAGWTDSTRRFFVIEISTNLPVDEATTERQAKADAAQMNREWREARNRARGVLFGVLSEDETLSEGLCLGDTMGAVLDALTAAPEIVDALKAVR